MSMHDPISDMLTRIRNAQKRHIEKVIFPFSNLKINSLSVMKQQGYITDFRVLEANRKKDIEVDLKYFDGEPVIEVIKRVSKPSLRRYCGYEDLPTVRGGLGIAVISTSSGVMTDKEARSRKLGGEILFTLE